MIRSLMPAYLQAIESGEAYYLQACSPDRMALQLSVLISSCDHPAYGYSRAQNHTCTKLCVQF